MEPGGSETGFLGLLGILFLIASSTEKKSFSYSSDADAHIQNLLKIKEGKYEKENHKNKGLVTVKEFQVRRD